VSYNIEPNSTRGPALLVRCCSPQMLFTCTPSSRQNRFFNDFSSICVRTVDHLELPPLGSFPFRRRTMTSCRAWVARESGASASSTSVRRRNRDAPVENPIQLKDVDAWQARDDAERVATMCLEPLTAQATALTRPVKPAQGLRYWFEPRNSPAVRAGALISGSLNQRTSRSSCASGGLSPATSSSPTIFPSSCSTSSWISTTKRNSLKPKSSKKEMEPVAFVHRLHSFTRLE
jgi:hypothetical protein